MTYIELQNYVLNLELDEYIPLPVTPKIKGAPTRATWHKYQREGIAPPVYYLGRTPHLTAFSWREHMRMMALNISEQRKRPTS
jgi:hypothetical protein